MPGFYDSHVHTPLCKHAEGAPREYAAVARRRGLKGIIFTCHNPAPFGWSPEPRMSIHQFGEYVALIQGARAQWAGRVDVRLGLESDYMPGMETWLEDLHAKAPLDYVLGALHPHLPEYKSAYLVNNDILGYQRTYFEHLAIAAETGLFDALSHPDYIKSAFPDDWNLDRVLDDVKRSLDRIARTGVAMELNTGGLRDAIPEMCPGVRILEEMRARDIPVVVGSDAHKPTHVGEDFEQALQLLADVGYTHVHTFLERKPQSIEISAIKLS